MLVNTYYSLKPLIPRRLQIILRRRVIQRKLPLHEKVWPIDTRNGAKPEGWPGWPQGKQFALVLTHDVETARGQEKCLDLMTVEERLGFRSSFNFVPERYQVSSTIRQHLTSKGFEVGVHGLHHDGKLYRSKEIFQRRAARINEYLKQWGSVGFRSPSMHHNLNWIHALNIKYDASTFDTDPFEPDPGGVGTIFPFWVGENSGQGGYVEIPYTLPQDFTLFVLLRENTINIWQKKLDWIVEKGGMALLLTHPDYMNFNDERHTLEQYPVEFYLRFLEYIKTRYDDEYWHPLPRELANFCEKNIKNR